MALSFTFPSIRLVPTHLNENQNSTKWLRDDRGVLIFVGESAETRKVLVEVGVSAGEQVPTQSEALVEGF